VADGEQVVVTGQLTIMPGGKVHVQEPGPANAPPGAAPAGAASPGSGAPAKSSDSGNKSKS
jgi:hypothetical protein